MEAYLHTEVQVRSYDVNIILVQLIIIFAEILEAGWKVKCSVLCAYVRPVAMYTGRYYRYNNIILYYLHYHYIPYNSIITYITEITMITYIHVTSIPLFPVYVGLWPSLLWPSASQLQCSCCGGWCWFSSCCCQWSARSSRTHCRTVSSLVHPLKPMQYLFCCCCACLPVHVVVWRQNQDSIIGNVGMDVEQAPKGLKVIIGALHIE